MAKQFDWQRGHSGGTFTAKMPNDVTLVVTADQVCGHWGDPKRGTAWRAQASQFDGRFTISRFGRDVYDVLHKRREDAMRAAEALYLEATA